MLRPTFHRAGFIVGCLAATILLNYGAHAGTVRVGGTGMGLAAMQAMGEDLTAAQPDIRVEVLPSLGTPGGLRALKEGAIHVAIIARRLTPEEKEQGFAEAGCALSALVFTSSLGAPPGIATKDLARIYTEARPTWPDGSPMKVILRSRAGSEVPYLAAAVPGLGPAFETAYKHPGTPVGATDQENAELAQKVAGSLAIITLLQIRAEHLNLRPLSLDGVAPSAETIANKTYPLPLPVCIVLTNSPQPDAARLAEHFKSPTGQALLRSFSAAPLD